jgi:hypothetical protein
MNVARIPGTNVPETLVTPQMVAQAKQALLDIDTFLKVHGAQLDAAGIDYSGPKQQLLDTREKLLKLVKVYGS